MAEQEQNRFTKRRLEIKRRRERVRRIKMQLISLFFVVLLACMIGLFCRHLILQKETQEIYANAETVILMTATDENIALSEWTEEAVQTRPAAHWDAENLMTLRLFYSAFSSSGGWNMAQRENGFCLAPQGDALSALRLRLESQPEGMSGTLEYSVVAEGAEWTDWTSNGAVSGFESSRQNISSFRARFTGELDLYYDLYYSVLEENVWSDWMRNGETAGVSGSIQGIRVSVIRKVDEGAVVPGGVDPSRPMIALTYDDGPTRNVTPRILETLAKYDARATFFIVASRVENNQDIVRQMSQQGSEVGNHTFDHVAMNKVDAEYYTAQLHSANQTIFEAGGVSPILMRPCEGVVTVPGMTIVGSFGMSAVLWTIDTKDWKTRDADQTVDAVLNHIKDGDIVLMHDLYDATADATEILVPELINRGYQLVTVSELAACRGGIQAGQKYYSFR